MAIAITITIRITAIAMAIQSPVLDLGAAMTGHLPAARLPSGMSTMRVEDQPGQAVNRPGRAGRSARATASATGTRSASSSALTVILIPGSAPIR